MLLALRSLYERITADATSGQAGQTEDAALLLTVADAGSSAQGQEANGASSQIISGTGTSGAGGQTGASNGAESITASAISAQAGQSSIGADPEIIVASAGTLQGSQGSSSNGNGLLSAGASSLQGQSSAGALIEAIAAGATSIQGSQSGTANDVPPIFGDATSGQDGQSGDAQIDQQQVGAAIMFMDSVDSGRPRRQRRIDPRYDERFYPDEDDATPVPVMGAGQSTSAASSSDGKAVLRIVADVRICNAGSVGAGAIEFTPDPSEEEWMLVLAEAA